MCVPSLLKYFWPIKSLESNVVNFLIHFRQIGFFVLLEVITLLKLDTLFSKSVFYTKYAFLGLNSTFVAVFNLPTSVLATSAFKLTKSDFATNLELSIPSEFLKSAFIV